MAAPSGPNSGGSSAVTASWLPDRSGPPGQTAGNYGAGQLKVSLPASAGLPEEFQPLSRRQLDRGAR